MQDRFKVRVWDKQRKEYVYDVQATYDYGCENIGSYEHCNFQRVIEDDDFIVEQCTGLKDKNGKLIYEGDILGGIYGGFIKWCDNCKSFAMFFEEHCFSCNGDILWFEIVEKDGEIEVIGNIHENPDLLELEDE